MEEWEAEPVPAVFVTDSRHADAILAKAGIVYENEIQIAKIGFCRLENQQDCVVGTLCIPKLLDVLGSRYRMYFFVNRSNVVIVDGSSGGSRESGPIRGRRKNGSSTTIFQSLSAATWRCSWLMRGACSAWRRM